MRFIDGTLRPLLSLPPKTCAVLPVDLSPKDREAYDALFHFARSVMPAAATRLSLKIAV